MRQKKYNFCFLISLILLVHGYAQSQINLKVCNPHSYALYDYPVKISLSEMGDSLAEGKDYRITDKITGKDFLLQRMPDQSSEQKGFILFQDSYDKNEIKEYTLTVDDKPIDKHHSQVYCRFVPERMDDFAWENDRIAFRMYGPALEGELVSSGIDVWLKKTSQLVIDNWYARGDYHEDHGQGLDCYSVGSSLGCGGTAVWQGNRLYSSRNFTSWKIGENGPLRLRFELSYHPWEVNGFQISENKEISLLAGQNFNKIQSHFQIQGKEQEVTLAIGIKIHEELNSHSQGNEKEGWISVWEETPKNGAYGCAVLIDPVKINRIIEAEGHILILSDIGNNDILTYYTGAGWDQSGFFPSEGDWIDYIRQMIRQIHTSAKVSYP